MQHTHITPNKDSTTDQSVATAQIQLGEPMVLLGLQGQKWLNSNCITITPHQHEWQLTKGGKPGAHCTTFRHFFGLESWSKPLQAAESTFHFSPSLLPPLLHVYLFGIDACGSQRTTCRSWFLFFHPVDPRDGTQVVRFGGKSLQLLSHL